MAGPEIFIVFVLLAVGLLVFTLVRNRKRREEIHQLAAQLGMTYSRYDSTGIVRLPFDLFRMGAGQGVENVLSGVRGDTPSYLFDYWYYTETRDSKGQVSRSYNHFSCAMVEMSGRFPNLSIAPEGLLTRLADGLGMRDITFESEEFNRRFEIKSDNRKFAFDLIDARMMEWLLANSGKARWEISGPYLLCAVSRIPIASWPGLADRPRLFRENIPRVVWSLYGPGGGQRGVEVQ